MLKRVLLVSGKKLNTAPALSVGLKLEPAGLQGGRGPLRKAEAALPRAVALTPAEATGVPQEPDREALIERPLLAEHILLPTERSWQASQPAPGVRQKPISWIWP